mgnify:CR=1 FL=1
MCKRMRRINRSDESRARRGFKETEVSGLVGSASFELIGKRGPAQCFAA